jgi:hypothetical protein
MVVWIQLSRHARLITHKSEFEQKKKQKREFSFVLVEPLAPLPFLECTGLYFQYLGPKKSICYIYYRVERRSIYYIY